MNWSRKVHVLPGTGLSFHFPLGLVVSIKKNKSFVWLLLPEYRIGAGGPSIEKAFGNLGVMLTKAHKEGKVFKDTYVNEYPAPASYAHAN